MKRKKLRAEINRIKSIAWQELLNSVNEDPWGLSYKLVLGKLRLATPGLTEILDSESLETLLISLLGILRMIHRMIDRPLFGLMTGR